MQLPDFGSIASQAQDAVDKAMEQAEEIAANATAQANAVAEDLAAQANEVMENATAQAKTFVNDAATQAAVFAAQSLNKTLLLVGEQSGALRDECARLRNLTVERARAAEPTVSARLAALDAAVQASVGGVLPVWNNITIAIKATGDIASTSLVAVGAKELGEKLSASLDALAAEGKDMAASLRNLSTSVTDLQNSSEEELMEGLRRTNKTLDMALVHAEQYASSVLEAFDDLTSKASSTISEAMSGINATVVSAAFSEVDTMAEEVFGRIVQGPKELAAGVGEAVWLLESTLPESLRGAAARSPSTAAAAAVTLAAIASFKVVA